MDFSTFLRHTGCFSNSRPLHMLFLLPRISLLSSLFTWPTLTQPSNLMPQGHVDEDSLHWLGQNKWLGKWWMCEHGLQVCSFRISLWASPSNVIRASLYFINPSLETQSHCKAPLNRELYLRRVDAAFKCEAQLGLQGWSREDRRKEGGKSKEKRQRGKKGIVQRGYVYILGLQKRLFSGSRQ